MLMLRRKGHSISENLAQFVTGITYDELPPDVVQKAKVCILDLFGAHYAGYDIESCKPVRDYISGLDTSSQATVWSLGTRTLTAEAAFSNSAVTHSTIFDDMHTQSVSHFGSIVIPSAIAVAEHKGCSGKELILAIVCGYEVGVGIGTALMTREFLQSGFRPSGTFGAFGSSAAAGKLLGLNADQMTKAFGFAANFAVGLTAFGQEGTDDMIYHNGLASRNGVLSCMLAEKGATSPRRIFEVDNGFCSTYHGDVEVLKGTVGGLGDTYKIKEVYFKSVPACAFVQSTARAALEIALPRDDFVVGDIKGVEVRIFHQGKYYPGCDCAGPFESIMQAQMSNQFTVATILVHKGVSFENYRGYRDPSVQDLTRKVKVIEDKESTSKFPDEQVAKVEVFLKDGSGRTAISRNPRGLDDSEVVEKSKAYLGRILSDETCNQVIDMVQRLETLKDVNELTRLLDRDKWLISPR